MEELIAKWKELNGQAKKLLDEHKSFRQYHAVRNHMDKIEKELSDKYNINYEDLHNM